MSGEMGHLFFAAMVFLQKKIDCELYAIVDRAPSVMEFFNTQQFVKFKKTFFYRKPKIETHEPDYEYLKNFETKHKINLWSIAYMDPSFYKYDEKANFSEREILSILEEDCRFFEKIFLEVKPDFLILHVGGMKHLNLLERMYSYYGTKRLIFSPAKFGPRYQISENYDIVDEQNRLTKNKNLSSDISDEELHSIKNKLALREFYSKRIKTAPHLQKKNFLLATIMNIVKQNETFYTQYGNYKKNYFISNFDLFLKQIIKYYRKKYLDKISNYKVNPNEKFVFFPLHAQPEQTITVRAPFYTNQLSLIKNIAQSLPIDYQLYVKEHYFMGVLYKWRSPSYYKKLVEIPNVKLFHPSVDSSELYEKCDLVVTINGSATYESLFYRKPVIVFADTSTMDLPSVTKVTNLEDLPSIIRKMLLIKNTTSGYKEYFESKFNETFFVKPSIFDDIFNQFFIYAGSVDDITNSKMEQFLEKHKQDLDNISERFIQKIKEFSNKSFDKTSP